MRSEKHFILKLGSYESEGSSLSVDANGEATMFVVLLVEERSAEIVDWGYESVEALLAAWHDTKFENRDEFA